MGRSNRRIWDQLGRGMVWGEWVLTVDEGDQGEEHEEDLEDNTDNESVTANTG